MSTTSVNQYHKNRRFVAVVATFLFLLSAVILTVPSHSSDASITQIQSPVVTEIEPTSGSVLDTDGDVLFDYTIESSFSMTTVTVSNSTTNSGYAHLDNPNGTHSSIDMKYLRNDSADLGGSWSLGVGTHTGYLFWSTGTTDKHDSAESQVVEFTVTTEYRTIYTYSTSISFDYNYSGSPEPYQDSVSESSLDSNLDKTITFDTPEIPVREDGLVFRGWATIANGEPTYGPEVTSIDLDVGVDLSLYAIWDEPYHMITFIVDGETYGNDTVPYDEFTSPPDDPEPPEGYIFAGWFTDLESEEPFEFGGLLDSDITLYAKWQEELIFTSKPTAEYNVTPIDGRDRTFLFSVPASAGATEIHWDFGDGHESTNSAETHYYSEPGTYHVTLTLTNSYGSTVSEFDVVADDGGEGNDILIYIAIAIACAIMAAIVLKRFI